MTQRIKQLAESRSEMMWSCARRDDARDVRLLPRMVAFPNCLAAESLAKAGKLRTETKSHFQA